MTETVKFKRLEHGIGLPLPEYKSDEASGMDICSAETLTIRPNGGAMVKTGWAVELPKGYEIQVRSRSGHAKEGVFVTNSPGTVDSDYRGEICILLSNLSGRTFHVEKGDRIAQLVLAKVPRLSVEEVEELNQSSRGEAGFGSTGVN